MNKGFREAKRKELIAKGYTLKFNWDDIEEIGHHIFQEIFCFAIQKRAIGCWTNSLVVARH